MKRFLAGRRLPTTVFSLALLLAIPGAVHAQQSGNAAPPKNGSGGQAPAEAPKVNPQEQADYKAFFDVQDPDKKISMGQAFVDKYPMSNYLPNVYAQMVVAYYSKQDWNNFYATADKTLVKNPDDVDVLTLVGWVIPHAYNSADPDAQKKLD